MINLEIFREIMSSNKNESKNKLSEIVKVFHESAYYLENNK
jgi:hypothetical protein